MNILGSEINGDDVKRTAVMGLAVATTYDDPAINDGKKPSNEQSTSKSPLKNTFSEIPLEKPTKAWTQPAPGDKQGQKTFMEKARHKPTKIMNSEGSEHKIFLFAITGGPCAGKTTCLQYLSERFAPKFKVFVVPEMAAMTVHSGVSIIPSNFTPESHTAFTKGIMKAQMDLESYFYNIALWEKSDVIIICDRGMMDNFAYCTPQVRQNVLDETGWTIQDITNKRYDAVFHLVTAADGAESFYTLENNEARTETAEVARMLDKWTQGAWLPHQNLYIIDNSLPGFDKKMGRLHNAICKYLNIPQGVHFTKKYLVSGEWDDSMLPKDVNFTKFEEEFTYLFSNDQNQRIWIKKRVDQSGNLSYSYVTRHLAAKEEHRMELKRKIGGKQFCEYCLQKDPKCDPVHKEYTVFLWNNITYIVEQFDMNGTRMTVLRVNTDNESSKNNATIPEFLTVAEDISENEKYFGISIAKTKFKESQENVASMVKTPSGKTSQQPSRKLS